MTPKNAHFCSVKNLLFTAAFALLVFQSEALGQIVFTGDVTNGTAGSITPYGGGPLWDHGSLQLIVGQTSQGDLFIPAGHEVKNATGLVGQDTGTGSTSSVTVDGSGATWTNSSFLTIGVNGIGVLNIDDGGSVTNGQVGPFAGTIASTGTGTVNVSNGSQWTNSGSLRMGLITNGDATLNINSGSTVSNTSGTVGLATSSIGRVSVDGGSTWTNTSVLTLGELGTGTLDITGGSTVTATAIEVATNSTATGDLEVSGAGSQLISSSNLSVGGTSSAVGGTGTLTINNDGAVTVETILRVWDDGTVNLQGGNLEVFRLDLEAPTATADFNMTGGTLTVSNDILGDFQQDGGDLVFDKPFFAVDISEDYIMNAGEVSFDIAGSLRGLQYDALDVLGSGGATLNGTIDVNLDSFDPMLGQSFLLINAMAYTEGAMFEFNFDDADLQSGLAWDTSTFFTDGQISIVSAVPEPGSIVLLSTVIIGLALRRRKSLV